MRTVLLQIAGWAVLLWYFTQTPITFNLWWALLHVVIFVMVAVTYAVILKPLIARIDGVERDVEGKKDAENTLYPHPKNAPIVAMMLRRPYMVLLAPGEDGIFFVPVALIGVTWWAALLASVLFGLAHYRTYSTSQCVVKSVGAFLCCLFVLPHGVINFVVGHFLLDAFATAAFVLSAWKDGLLASDKSANRVSAGISPALPTPPSRRVRTKRLKQGNENIPTSL